MMPVISAEGDCGPPPFAIKGKRVPYRKVLRNGTMFAESPLSLLPRFSVLATRAENGGVDRQNFYSWDDKFVQYTKDLRAVGQKVLLVYDAYRSHISLEVLSLFKENGIIVYALPAHTSDKTQPLDMVLFSVFKDALNQAVSDCSGFSDDKKLDLFDLCSIMKKAYNATFTKKNIRAGLRRAGLFPVDPARLLNCPRPESASNVSTIMSTDQLETLYDAKRKDMIEAILGSDAKILESGYVDTKNGCVMTSPEVLALMHKKDFERERKKTTEKENA